MQRQLDHEKLDVYQLELQFVAWATDLMAELSGALDAKSRRMTETFDHLERASLSSLFNTAEGTVGGIFTTESTENRGRGRGGERVNPVIQVNDVNQVNIGGENNE